MEGLCKFFIMNLLLEPEFVGLSVWKLGFLEKNFENCLTFRGIGFDFDLIRNVCLLMVC